MWVVHVFHVLYVGGEGTYESILLLVRKSERDARSLQSREEHLRTSMEV